MKGASVYYFIQKNKYLIHSKTQIKSGGSIATDPFIWVDVTATAKEKAEAILKALQMNGKPIPTPNWTLFAKELLQKMNLKNNSELYKQTKLIEIAEIDRKIEFYPSINQGAKNGFKINKSEMVSVSIDESFDKIVTNLETAFLRAE